MEKARANLFDIIVAPRSLSATRLHAARRLPKQALLPNSGGQGVSGFRRWNPSRGGVRRNNAVQTTAATRRLTLCGATMPAPNMRLCGSLLDCDLGPTVCITMIGRELLHDGTVHFSHAAHETR